MSGNTFEEKHVKKGEILFLEGEKPKYIYIVINGRILGATKSTNRLIPLYLAKKGEIVGEEGIVSMTYQYTAIAMKDTQLIPIKLSEVKEFLNSTPNWVNNIMSLLAERISSIQMVIKEQKIIAPELCGGEDLSNEEQAFVTAALK